MGQKLFKIILSEELSLENESIEISRADFKRAVEAGISRILTEDPEEYETNARRDDIVRELRGVAQSQKEVAFGTWAAALLKEGEKGHEIWEKFEDIEFTRSRACGCPLASISEWTDENTSTSAFPELKWLPQEQIAFVGEYDEKMKQITGRTVGVAKIVD